jgi:hypothetical protein
MERAALSLSSVGWLTRKFMEIESWCEPLRGERCHVPRFHLRGKGSRGVHLESWWLADSNGEDLSSTTSADLVEGAVQISRELLQSGTNSSPHVLDETMCILIAIIYITNDGEG